MSVCLSLCLLPLTPVPGLSGRGQEGLSWPPLALLPALWGLDRKLGLRPEPRLPPRLPSPHRAARRGGGGKQGTLNPRSCPCIWLGAWPPRQGGWGQKQRSHGKKVLSPQVSFPGSGQVGGVCRGRGQGSGTRSVSESLGCSQDLSWGPGTSWACEGLDPGGVSGCVGLLGLGSGV